MKPIFRRALAVLVAAFLLIQFMPAARTNPPVKGPLTAPPQVLDVLERACFDCHSNETAWPWYTRLAPFSWLAVRDVEEGREELNFSNWALLDPGKAEELREECWEEVAEGEMPLWFYEPLHPHARLTDADREVLRQWAGAGKVSARSDLEDDDDDDDDEDDD